jgi:hypothetical protein
MANDKFKATPVSAGNNTVPNSTKSEKIKSTDFLPKYHQTPTNNKFFNVTLDPLISKGAAEDINAYIGRKSGTVYKPAKDSYVAESRKDREDYQFDVGVVSKNMDQAIVNKFAYADILEKYKTQYSNFKPSDLDTNFYSWDPAIDPDKFINFTQYYWLPTGLPPLEIKGNIDVERDVNGLATYTTPSGLTLHNGMRVFFTHNNIADPAYVSRGDTERSFTSYYPTGTFNVSDLISRNYSIHIDVTYTNMETFKESGLTLELDGVKRYSVTKNVYVPEFYTDANGKVLARNWFEVAPGVIALSYEGILNGINPKRIKVRVQVINKPIYFTVSGVGQNIELLSPFPKDPPLPYIMDIPEGYDSTPYGTTRFDQFTPTGGILTDITEATKRPPWKGAVQLFGEEFDSTIFDSTAWDASNIIPDGSGFDLVHGSTMEPHLPYMLQIPEGYDFMNHDITPWDASVTGLLQPEYIVMQLNSNDNNAWSRANHWVHIDAIEATFYELKRDFKTTDIGHSRGKRPIIEFRAGMQLMNHGSDSIYPVDLVADGVDPYSIISNVSAKIDGVELKNKQRILFINSKNESFNNKVAIVANVGRYITLTFSNLPKIGNTVLVKDGDKFATNEFWFDGTTWNIAQLKTAPNQFPLFALHDFKGNRVDDQKVYKSSNFIGSTVFQYKTGSFYDSELYFNVEYEESSYDILNNASPFAKNFANLKFDWSQNTQELFYDNNGNRAQILGTYYVKINNRDGTTDYSNGWVRNANEPLTFQRIAHVVADANADNTIIVPADVVPSYEYQAYLENGKLQFNIISKDGSVKVWNPVNKNLLFPIGRDAIIHNYTGLPFTISDSDHQSPSVVFNNGTTNDIIAKFTEDDVKANRGNYLYYQCAGYKNVIHLVDPLSESRSVQVRKNGSKLTIGVDYTMVSDDISAPYIITINELSLNDFIEVLCVSNEHVGAYGTHATLEANADNESFRVTSFSKVFEHFTSMINTQALADGPTFGQNTWHDSPRGFGNGYIIQQQDNSLLLPSLFLGAHIDPAIVLTKAGVAYSSFRSKFISNLQQIHQQIDTKTITAPDLVDKVLSQINVGKNSTFTNANSGMIYWKERLEQNYTADGFQRQFKHGSTQVTTNLLNDHIYVYLNGAIICDSFTVTETSINFINTPTVGDLITIRVYPKTQLSLVPPSLAKLGISEMRYPAIIKDSTTAALREYILCHDGSEVTAFDDVYINDAILEFERRVFSGAVHNINSTKTMELNAGAYRKTLTSWDDKNEFMHQFYIKWAFDNSIKDMHNISYDEANAFTWNYPATANTVAGSYRAIYMNLFDTFTPHIAPWEMLGHTIKPKWWDVHYAWNDVSKRVRLENSLRMGLVSEPGTAAPTYNVEFARSAPIFPVSTSGDLLDPVTAGICEEPPIGYPKSAWKFGEYGSQEMAWRRSASFQWAEAIWQYSVSPHTFFAKNFDTFSKSTAIDGYQQIVTEFGRRTTVAEAVMHRQNGAYKLGLSQLFSEYIISLNKDLSSDYYQAVNNGHVQMVYKVGGYADKRTMRFKADTLKQSSGSTFIPEENFNIHLYKGSAYSKQFYSGVRVIWNGVGYEVSGFDRVNSYFLAYLPKSNSRSRAIKFNNVNILESYDLMTTTTKIPYGTVFQTRQEVYDLFAGLNKYMIEAGFAFDQYDETYACMSDFALCGKQFMFWSETLWSAGNYIALSPMSELIKFKHDYGTIDDYVSMMDYDPITGINGENIDIKELNFDRSIVGEFTASTVSNGVGVFGMAIDLVEVEHAVVFDNTTTFGDTIYNPIYRLKQYRLKYLGQRTADWDGTTYCAGFLLNNDKIIGNFDRTIADISDSYYGIEGYTQNSQLIKTARHSTGLQSTGALNELIDNQNNLFEFSKSLIRQKGTPAVYTKILRSAAIEGSSDSIMPDEEWMFKLGEFGNINAIQSWEFRLKQSEFKENKQLIRFNSSYKFIPTGSSYSKNLDSTLDRTIDIMTDDSRWVHKPVAAATNFAFSMRPSTTYATDLVNAGYATKDEADFTAVSIDELNGLYSQLITTVNDVIPTYRIWVSDYTSNVDMLNADRFTNQNVTIGWNMLVLQDKNLTIDLVTPVVDLPTAPPTITFIGLHNLMVGDLILITGTNAVDGVHTVLSTTTDSITIDAVISDIASGGKVISLMPTRFATVDIMEAALRNNRYSWKTGQLIFIDSVNGGYATYKVTENGNAELISAAPISAETKLTDAGLIKSVVIYDRTSNRELIELDIYDPFKGFIPSAADRNIDIKSANDPALYSFTTDSEIEITDISPWGIDQVGSVWWDLSTSKFMDYEQGSLEYRHSNWGRLFPNASIDVYQWIESTVPPLVYNEASLNATPIEDVVPVGTAKVSTFGQDTVYSYAIREITKSDGTLSTLYYFWVKGLDTISPARMDKTMPVISIANTIQDPTDMGIAWAAPISEDAMIISGVTQFLNNDSTTVQIQFVDYAKSNIDMDPEVHSQWVLLRENDSVLRIPEWLHGKIRDSLAGFDASTQVLNWTVYDSAMMYKVGEIVQYNDAFYRVFRDMNVGDSTKEFADLPLYRVYDYTLLPTDLMGNHKIKIESRRDVPDYRADVYDRYGNATRPIQQTWIKDRSAARRTFIASANKLLAKMDLFETVPTWNKHLSTIVKGTYEYDISKFYDVIDYVSPDYNELRSVDGTYSLETDIDYSIIPNGGYVLVQNQNRYAVYQLVDGQHILVFKRNATIQFNEDLFNGIKQQFSWDLAPWDFLKWDNEPGVEFGEIVTAMREDIFVGEYSMNYNILFFDMVRYVFSENDAVDWIAKSSYLYIDNLDVGDLSPKPYMIADKIQKYIDHINEIKPYRTKIRQVIDTRPALDNVSINMTDINFMDIEMTYVRPETEGRLLIQGGKFGRLNYSTLNGNKFGVPSSKIVNGGKFTDISGYGENAGTGEVVPTRVPTSLSFEVVSTYDTGSYAFRAYIAPNGKASYTRIAESHTAKLAAPLKLNDHMMVVDDGDALPMPATTFNVPASVMINGERIEYYAKIGNELWWLRRGVDNTAMMDHAEGSNVYSDSKSMVLPQPSETGLMFNDIGRTLIESTNDGALLILKEQGN